MDQYYLQDSRFFLGNTVVWWCIDGGFTVDVSKAKTFTKDEADAWHELRESDIPWPKAYIDDRTRPTVDLLDIERRDADRAVYTNACRLPHIGQGSDSLVVSETSSEELKNTKPIN